MKASPARTRAFALSNDHARIYNALHDLLQLEYQDITTYSKRPINGSDLASFKTLMTRSTLSTTSAWPWSFSVDKEVINDVK